MKSSNPSYSSPIEKQAIALLREAQRLFRCRPSHENLDTQIAHLLDECETLSLADRWMPLVRQDMALLRSKLAGKRGDYPMAVLEASRALNINLHDHKNETHSKRAIALSYIGYALLKQGHFARASAALERSQSAFDAIDPSRQRHDDTKQFNMVQRSLQLSYEQQALHSHCETLSPPPPIKKFPRTPHLLDLGSMTEDDLLLTDTPASHVLNNILCNGSTRVVVEEKIDGANMGISLCPVSGKLLVQNRSHYVSSGAEQAQFSRLPEWLIQHESSLRRILWGGDDGVFLQNRILFGEWMTARHSLPYHRLPGFFVAFDILDRTTGKFLSRKRFHTILQGTGIPVVPVLSVRTFGPYHKKGQQQPQQELLKQDLLPLLNSPSAFRTDDGTVEGVVLRVDSDEEWLGHRVKVVRPDFVAGCAAGHWSRRTMEKQRVDYEFASPYLQSCYPFASSADETPKKSIEKTERSNKHDRCSSTASTNTATTTTTTRQQSSATTKKASAEAAATTWKTKKNAPLHHSNGFAGLGQDNILYKTGGVRSGLDPCQSGYLGQEGILETSRIV